MEVYNNEIVIDNLSYSFTFAKCVKLIEGKIHPHYKTFMKTPFIWKALNAYRNDSKCYFSKINSVIKCSHIKLLIIYIFFQNVWN